MSQITTPTSEYHLRKRQRKSLVTCTSTKLTDECHSGISSEAERSPLTVSCNAWAKVSFNGCPTRKEALINDAERVFNDNCSSSKLNLESASANLGIDSLDESGRCSSPCELIAEKPPQGIPETDVCISFANGDKYCSKPCKVCGNLDSTLNMIICDTCGDAFHPLCCNPNITEVPIGYWHCSSCWRKKHGVLKGESPNISVKVNISSPIGRKGNSASKGTLGSVGFMFDDNEPYISRVPIGDEFQVNVPDWSGPIDDEGDPVVARFETVHSDNISMQEHCSNKDLKLGCTSTWLQCQEIIEGIGEGVEGTICGKWRRAPLNEAQTDEWECFDCFRWDPSRADCAVPQEVHTEEVMKQLKYIETLRPRQAAKRRNVK